MGKLRLREGQGLAQDSRASRGLTQTSGSPPTSPCLSEIVRSATTGDMKWRPDRDGDKGRSQGRLRASARASESGRLVRILVLPGLDRYRLQLGTKMPNSSDLGTEPCPLKTGNHALPILSLHNHFLPPQRPPLPSPQPSGIGP